MKLDFKQILNIKNKSELKNINEPIFLNNYLFHYLIIFDKLDILKMEKFPVYKENDEGLNGFFLAAKYENMEILLYLIQTYPEYIYNTNEYNNTFIDFLSNENILKLIHLNLEWERLLNNKIYELHMNLNYNELKLLFSYYKQTNMYLGYLINNTKLNTKQIIEFLLMFKNDINIRDEEDKTIIFECIFKKDIELVKFCIENNVIIDYYTIFNTINPLKTAILHRFNEGYKLIWNKIKPNFKYNTTNRRLENILHFILYNYIDLIDKKDQTIIDIILNSTEDAWHQYDINKMYPLQIITELEFDKYNYLLKNKSVNLDLKPISLRTILNANDEPNAYNWLTYLNKLKKYEINNDVILNNYNFNECNTFSAQFKDMAFYIEYIKNKFNNLYIPDINSYSINKMDDITITWPDNAFYEKLFPWIICYIDQDNYWIHEQLNNLINAQKKKNKYRFVFCFLSLKLPNDGLHANILIYDLKNMTLERFDPYGNTVSFDSKIDDILEEELTWNTGFEYLKPSDYMPVAGYQTISDELNELNQKNGDFGGYCLAWSIFYLEHRIINEKLKPQELFNKIMHKLTLNKYTFNQYIRNYANYINFYRLNKLKKLGIKKENVTNINFNNTENNIILDYIINSN